MNKFALITLSIAFCCLPVVSHGQDANGVCRQPPSGATPAPPLPSRRSSVRRTTVARAVPPVAPTTNTNDSPTSDTFGYGGLGSTGLGWDEGSTSGAGRGLRGRGTSGPTVRSIDPLAWIRDTIHSHHDEVQRCYGRSLSRNGQLTGHVTAHFAILSNGHVARSPTLSLDPGMDDEGFRTCLTQTIQSWVFTPPRGIGVTTVNYPYDFSSPEETAVPRRARRQT